MASRTLPAWFAPGPRRSPRRTGTRRAVAMQEFYSLVSRVPSSASTFPPRARLGSDGALEPAWLRPFLGQVLARQHEGGRTTQRRQSVRRFPLHRAELPHCRRPPRDRGRTRRSMPQVALAWLRSKPGVASILLGARKMEQLEDNLSSLTLELSPEVIERLETATEFELGGVYGFTVPGSPMSRNVLFGGAPVGTSL